MGSLTSFCPNCWVETRPDDSECPRCGFRMAAFDALGYEGKLLLALKHPIPENRMLAIQLLGELNSQPAALVFATILDHEEDPYVLSEIVQALARIDGGKSLVILERLRSHHSVIVRKAAEDACRAATDLCG
jgi:HEAT repeat protein